MDLINFAQRVIALEAQALEQMSQRLSDSFAAAVTDLQKALEANDLVSYKSKLHLRGDKDAVFKFSRKAIAASAKAGVDQVIFATYSTDK